jgi:polyphosphate kinase 2 (PPK2 family)
VHHDAFIVPPNSNISLKKDYDPAYKADNYQKTDATSKLQASIQQIANYQNILYAQNTYALLIIFQAMDAAGKDSTIKHVMSGVNPQGFQVFNFQAPSAE